MRNLLFALVFVLVSVPCPAFADDLTTEQSVVASVDAELAPADETRDLHIAQAFVLGSREFQMSLPAWTQPRMSTARGSPGLRKAGGYRRARPVTHSEMPRGQLKR